MSQIPEVPELIGLSINASPYMTGHDELSRIAYLGTSILDEWKTDWENYRQYGEYVETTRWHSQAIADLINIVLFQQRSITCLTHLIKSIERRIPPDKEPC